MDVLRREYETQLPTLERLRIEADFETAEVVKRTGVKTHSQSSRVKSTESFMAKVDRREYGAPLEDMTDKVGLRVVTLFLADIPRLADALSKNFEIREDTDRIEGSDKGADITSFGYMSRHLIVQIKKSRRGPRYDGIKETPFEIQLRTILMDAWANVSHYLDYKGESSIPSQLRRDFFALSGLFYVADKHFELFFGRKSATRREAEVSVDRPHPDLRQEINLETLEAYLKRAFPRRRHSDSASIAELAEELNEAGYKTLADLDQALLSGKDTIGPHEKSHPPQNRQHYLDVGIVRVTLAVGDRNYRLMKYGPAREELDDEEIDWEAEYEAFVPLIRTPQPGERFVEPKLPS